MKARELESLGFPRGAAMSAAFDAVGAASRAGMDHRDIRNELRKLVANPYGYREQSLWGGAARALIESREARRSFEARAEPARYRQWGTNLDEQAVQQMENACKLPVTVSGALMPDAHVGYGLPIGGVLAVRNAVIPYAVGVDIACRMKLTVLDLPISSLEKEQDRLASAIHRETRFGIGASFKHPQDHPVMDEDWAVSRITRENRDKAWSQLGTSGSGNHFVEFGTLTLAQDDLGLEAGTYVALLSHSGSRGTGAAVCAHYSRLARNLHPELPPELAYLAWLDLDSEAGREYWNAMELMGKYAAANHALIHRNIARNLGVSVLLDLENHHNFAWKETHGGEELIVHRKGATPAGAGVVGIIPGSMAAPGFVVRGRGVEASLNSAAHGAGRRMSRTQAKKTYHWDEVKRLLRERGVTLISAGLDEVPMAYKNIEEVMAAQSDLVEVVARFDPRLVKMAPAGERPED